MTAGIDIAASEEIIHVLTAACVRAWKERRSVTGSSDVLIELSRRIKPFRDAISRETWNLFEERAAREPLDYCDRAQHPVASVGKAIDCEVSGTLREAKWLGRRRLRLGRDEAGPDWCQCVSSVLGRVFKDAAPAGVPDPQAAHLMLGIFSEAGSGAHRIMSDLGVDLSAVQRASVSGSVIRKSGSVYAPASHILTVVGAISSPDPVILRWMAKPIGWAVVRKTGVGAVAFAIGSEATRQAVRSGSLVTRVPHLLVAMSAVNQQRVRLGWRYRRAYEEHNSGGETLARWGLDYPAVTRLLVCGQQDPHGAVDPRRPWRVDAGDPFFDAAVVQVFLQARDLAASLKHARVSSDHLLMCSLTSVAVDIGQLLAPSGVNVGGLRRDVARQLGIAEN